MYMYIYIYIYIYIYRERERERIAKSMLDTFQVHSTWALGIITNFINNECIYIYIYIYII